ncbi:MAG: SCO family protein [Deltaproteobacteria bacterium]|nr:SCO family protein [Deltaproteobacteria bacterium]
MPYVQEPRRSSRSIEAIRNFISEGAFPIFAISLLACWEMFLIGVLVLPPSSSPLGAFAEDFRIWCFGYDPATGKTEWAYVMSMLMPQLMMGGFIALFWWQPLRKMLREPRRAAVHAGAAALIVAGSTLSFAFSSSAPTSGELPFPAADIRTEFTSPQLSLTNQEGSRVDLEALKGRVVLLTAVYASCGHTCPMILTQTKAALADLGPGELQDLTVIAVTLDPGHDSSAVLAQLADGHGLEAPLYNLVTGPSQQVERVLDDMQVARTRDPKTGAIDHANIFLVIDREGKIAYRLSLGERQKTWLTAALRVLLREPRAAG